MTEQPTLVKPKGVKRIIHRGHDDRYTNDPRLSLSKLRQEDIAKNRYGSLVDKAMAERCRKNPWSLAVSQAKVELGLPTDTFIAVRKHTPLWERAHAIMAH